MLRQLIISYGYAVVFVGCALEGETVLVIGGISAKLGYLDLGGVMLAATAGSYLGDQFYFFIGRRYGTRILQKRPRWQAGAARVNRLLDRYQTWYILGFRFIYGIRTVSPFVLGMGRVSTARFAFLNLIAACIWAVTGATLGFAFGHTIEILLDEIVRYERFILEAALGTGIVFWAVRFIRARRRAMDATRVKEPPRSDA